MIRTLMSDTELSIINLFFTLLGLLGTFFAVQLGSWYSNLLSLHRKWEMNQDKATADEIAALRECKYELKGLYNHVTPLITVIVTGFLALITFKILALTRTHSATDIGASDVQLVTLWFVVIYSILRSIS